MRQALQSLVLLIAIFPNASISEITSIKNYDEISENIFWSDLYPGGGWSLYCGFRFENQSNSNENHLFVIEHIYPVSEMLKFLKC